MAKIDSAPQGKKVLEQKSEKTSRGFRDDTAVAVSRYDRDYLDMLVKDRENLTGKTQTVKDELHHIITAYRRAISGPGVKA